MSYDITFIQKSFEQSWDEALKENENRALARRTNPAQPSQSVKEGWDRLASLFLEINPNLSRNDGLDVLEMSDHESGLQISIYENEVGISIPFHHTGRDARKQVTYAYKYTKIIERETGLIGYDSQRKEAFLHSEGAIGDSVDILSSTSKKMHQPGNLETNESPRKPWWKFWD